MGMQNSLLQQYRHRLSETAYKELSRSFGKCLPRKLLKNPRGTSRNRNYTLPVTFWAFLWQALQGNGSCLQAVQKVQALLLALRSRPVSLNTSAFCQARNRIQFSWLRAIHRHVARQLAQSGAARHAFGRRVCVVDSTTVTLPDTAENRQRYRTATGQKPGCGFPLLKIGALFCLGTGALLEYVTAPWPVHDSRLLRRLLKSLLIGDILLADRAFCSYASIAELRAHGVDVLFRLHQARITTRDRVRQLGKHDQLIRWEKPVQRTRNMSLERFRKLPPTLELRQIKVVIPIPGFRTRVLYLVTTLCDSHRDPAAKLADLFRQRWQAELYFRDIKISLRMEQLHCRCPAMVHKELAVYLIAYNLIRWLILQAATVARDSTAPISFKATIGFLQHCSWLAHVGRKLIPSLLPLIALCRVRQRPNRAEPRAVKRRPKPYQYLSNHRHLMVVTIHRDKYRKPSLS